MKFSLKFFGTPRGKIVLYITAGLVFFIVIYVMLKRASGATSGDTYVATGGVSDAQSAAALQQNLAQISANAGQNMASINADAQNLQAGLALQAALAGIQEQGNEAALAATVATATINAQYQGLLDSNKTGVATATIASNTILGQGAQQNQLLLGQSQIQAAMFNDQLKASYNQQLLVTAAGLSKKKTPMGIKIAISGAIDGINNTTSAPYAPAPTSINGISGYLMAAGGGTPGTFH